MNNLVNEAYRVLRSHTVWLMPARGGNCPLLNHIRSECSQKLHSLEIVKFRGSYG